MRDLNTVDADGHCSGENKLTFFLMQCSRLQSKLQSNEPQLALVSCAERKKVAKFVVIVR